MIETGRLRLCGWRDAGRAPFAAMSADADVMRHLDGPIERHESDAVIDRLSAHADSDGLTFRVVERQADGAFLGSCGLRRGGHPDTPVGGELEIGWRLARPYWGQGYAREAAEASIAHGWATTGDPRIAAWTVPANTASRGSMERLGMTHRAGSTSTIPASPMDIRSAATWSTPSGAPHDA